MDEEVEIAVNLALERFRYGEDTGAWGSRAERGGRAAGPAGSPGGRISGGRAAPERPSPAWVPGDSAATGRAVHGKPGGFGD